MEKGDKAIMKSKGKEAKAKEKAKEKEKESWTDLLKPALWIVFFAVALVGTALYLVAESKVGVFQPFQLATVAGLLGGFPLVAGYGEKLGDEGVGKKLKVIGWVYLLSAIMFVVFGFYQAADMAGMFIGSGALEWIMIVIYGVTFYVGALAMIYGMWKSLEMLGGLLKEEAPWQKVVSAVKRISEKKSK